MNCDAVCTTTLATPGLLVINKSHFILFPGGAELQRNLNFTISCNAPVGEVLKSALLSYIKVNSLCKQHSNKIRALQGLEDNTKMDKMCLPH